VRPGIGQGKGLVEEEQSVSGYGVAKISAESEAAIVEATGEWLESMRRWSVWGTLTIDHRRRQGQRIETLSREPVQRGFDERGFPRVYWGSRVLYEHRLDAPRPVPRDSLVWMVESAMKQASRLLGRRVDWVGDIEPHKNLELHSHVLVYTGQVGEGRNDIRALHDGWFCRGGYCRFEEPRDRMAVTLYIAKYLCKPVGELLFSPKLHLPPEPEFGRLTAHE
jgi:hypothetical protein